MRFVPKFVPAYYLHYLNLTHPTIPLSDISLHMLSTIPPTLISVPNLTDRMILSPYRNPPYRSPTPKDLSSPQTPKRKRKDAPEVEDRSLQLSTQTHDDGVTDTGADSPKTKVADRLKELDIRSSHSTKSRTSEHDPQRKRVKRPSGGRDSALQAYSPTSEDEVFEESKAPRFNKAESATAEVEETPDCRTRPQRSPSPPSSSPTHPIAYVEITPPKRVSTCQSSAIAQASSDPPSSPNKNLLASPSPGQEADSVDRSASPLPSKGDLTPDQAALTWQDHEITGHEIDSGGDDDGEGINGIGFRPTTAIAAARQQRRRQQVNEWRAREAKEARQKRFERRRIAGGGAGDAASSGGVGDAAEGVVMSSPSLARMVRFVGAGRTHD